MKHICGFDSRLAFKNPSVEAVSIDARLSLEIDKQRSGGGIGRH